MGNLQPVTQLDIQYALQFVFVSFTCIISLDLP